MNPASTTEDDVDDGFEESEVSDLGVENTLWIPSTRLNEARVALANFGVDVSVLGTYLTKVVLLAPDSDSADVAAEVIITQELYVEAV